MVNLGSIVCDYASSDDDTLGNEMDCGPLRVATDAPAVNPKLEALKAEVEPPLPDLAPAPPCCVCASNPRKYCCPRCGALTCSLECCSEHKKQQSCTGRRDASAYVSVRAMGLPDLRRDMAFLEAAGRQHGAAKRARSADQDWSPEAPQLGNRRRGEAPGPKLQRAAAARRVRLLLMAEGMSRRKKNTTSVARGGALRWRVEWLFDVPGEGPLTLATDSASEQTPLLELLRARVAAEPPSVQSKIKPWLDHLDNLALLLQRQPAPANEPRFDRLDSSVGLELNLAGKCVIEYPIIRVALPRDLAGGKFVLAPSVLSIFQDDEAAAAEP
ncbi:hypothetical protein M885DRAFT_616652 [Pelagophyceae sp. CCMP2097]|nr:hypothetical protein M885DRAFT_616652 [Pelagophyceae sp. CCMP2097]|mmetsp:Transcript_20608/g.70747  ORF Transcript_20608/g.70747 Transcript_20608/m.70747 type:complete len:328 (-) Transcript_20608:65-1048(-)